MSTATPVSNVCNRSVSEVQTRRFGLLWLLAAGCVVCMLSFGVSAGSVVVTDETGERRELYSNSYALLIGVSNYTNGWEDLDQIPSELDKARNALESHGFDVTMVTEETGMRELKSEIDDFIRRYGHNENNRLVFIYSGHGHTWSAGNQGYLVPSDAPVPDTQDGNPGEIFRANTLHISQMMEWARQMTARHVLFLFDSCFSGMVFKTRGREPAARRKTFQWKTNSQPSRQFITAGSAHELVPARSVFMPAFINAITTDEADYSEDGYLTGEELGIYLETVVPRYADQTPQYGTHPSWELSRGNFVFVLNEQNDSQQPITDVPANAVPEQDTPEQSQQLAKVIQKQPKVTDVGGEPPAEREAEPESKEKTLSLLQQLKQRQAQKKKKREEEDRLQAKKLAQEKLEQEKLEQVKLEQERLEQAELELAKLEQERLELAKLEQEKLELAKLEQEKLEQAKLEQERLELAKLEQEKLELAKLEQERLELAKLEQERLELAKLELAKLEQEKPGQEKLEQAKLEQMKLEQMKLEQAKLEQAKLEQEKLEQEKLEQAKLEQVKLRQAKLEQEKLEQVKLQQAKLDEAKLEQEKLAQKKLEQERLEQEARLASEQKAQQALVQAAVKTEELSKTEIITADTPVVVAAVDTATTRKSTLTPCSKVTPGRADYFKESKLSVAQQDFSVFKQPNHACKSDAQIAKGHGVVLLARHNQWVHLRNKETGSTGWVHQQTLNTTLSEVDARGGRVPLWKWLKGKVASDESTVQSTLVEPTVQEAPAQTDVALVAANEFSAATLDCDAVAPSSAQYHPSPKQFTTISRVKMFQKPDEQCQLYLLVDKSQGVMVLASQGDWVHLRDMRSGKRGWVSAQSLYGGAASQ